MKKFALALILVIIAIFFSVNSSPPANEQNFGEQKGCLTRVEFTEDKIKNCTFGSGSRHLFLVGDSVANSYSDVLRKISEQKNFKYSVLTAPSCVMSSIYQAQIVAPDPFLPKADYSNEFNHCLKYSKSIQRVILRSKSSDIIVMSLLDQYFWDKNIQFYDNRNRQTSKEKVIKNIFNNLLSAKGRIIFITPTPNFRLVNNGDWNLPTCKLFKSYLNKCLFSLPKIKVQSHHKTILSRSNLLAKHGRLYQIDSSNIVCMNVCPMNSHGTWLYKDFTHLSKKGQKLFFNIITDYIK